MIFSGDVGSYIWLKWKCWCELNPNFNANFNSKSNPIAILPVVSYANLQFSFYWWPTQNAQCPLQKRKQWTPNSLKITKSCYQTTVRALFSHMHMHFFKSRIKSTHQKVSRKIFGVNSCSKLGCKTLLLSSRLAHESSNRRVIQPNIWLSASFVCWWIWQ